MKWSNPEKGVAPSPTPWCSSYCSSFGLPSTKVGNLFFIYFWRYKKTKNKDDNNEDQNCVGIT